MALPVIKHPTISIEIPSTGNRIQFRPILVAEERVLLTASETREMDEILRAVKQIINNCALSEIDVEHLAIFDIEWIFLQLRAVSISNVIALEYEDSEDGKTYSVKFDIAEVEMPKPKADVNFDIKVDSDVGIKLSWPKGVIYGDSKTAADIDRIVASCITAVYTSTSTESTEDTEEVYKWIQTLSVSAHDEMLKFFEQVPILTHTISYKTDKGTERKITLQGLADFFGFR